MSRCGQPFFNFGLTCHSVGQIEGIQLTMLLCSMETKHAH